MSKQNFYYKHLLPYNAGQDIKALVQSVKDSGFDGIFFPYFNPRGFGKVGRHLYYPFSEGLYHARRFGLKVGLYITAFNNARLWKNKNFSPPVNHTGSPAVADANYHPICPNNPVGYDFFRRTLERLIQLPDCDFYLFESLRFPFNWLREDLDVQYPLPKYCYCPFCVTEFSSMMGEVVSYASQILDHLEEWLDWRTQVVNHFVSISREALAQKGRVIISVPPLALIDLPFTTGQLPNAISDMGCYIAPKLYHASRIGDFLWVEDVLDQFLLEINANKIFPQIYVTSEKEFEATVAVYEKYKPAGILMSIFAGDK